MIVEFLGPSGAGKTTIAARLDCWLEDLPLDVFTLPARSPSTAELYRISLAQPRLALRARRAIRRESSPQTRRRLAKVVLREWTIRELTEAVLPEGALHPLTTAMAMADQPRLLAGDILPRLRPPSVVVLLHVDPIESVARVRARAGASHRFERMDDQAATQFVERYLDHAEAMVRVMPAETWRYNTSRTSAVEVADDLGIRLRAILSPGVEGTTHGV